MTILALHELVSQLLSPQLKHARESSGCSNAVPLVILNRSLAGFAIVAHKFGGRSKGVLLVEIHFKTGYFFFKIMFLL